VMRSLIFAYPGESGFSDSWDEYLYGENILVAPVTTAGATSRSVTLPPGRWMNYNDKPTVQEGGKTVTAAAPLGTIPLFVREGAIVPRGDIVRLNNNWEANWKAKLRIEIFPAEKGASEFEYFTGTAAQKIRVSTEGDRVTIQFGDLGEEGVLEVYCRKAKDVVKNGVKLRAGSDYRYEAETQKLTIPFKGVAKVELLGTASVFAR
jgi:alpha-D-xyloside xylohydrolase